MRRGCLFGRAKGAKNTMLHAICDNHGRRLSLFFTAGQVRDYINAGALRSRMPNVGRLPGDRGHDADGFRDALKDKGVHGCISGRKQRRTLIKFEKRRYKLQNRIEIMLGRIKDCG